jgi:hypothetical protein
MSCCRSGYTSKVPCSERSVSWIAVITDYSLSSATEAFCYNVLRMFFKTSAGPGYPILKYVDELILDFVIEWGKWRNKSSCLICDQTFFPHYDHYRHRYVKSNSLTRKSVEALWSMVDERDFNALVSLKRASYSVPPHWCWYVHFLSIGEYIS